MLSLTVPKVHCISQKVEGKVGSQLSLNSRLRSFAGSLEFSQTSHLKFIVRFSFNVKTKLGTKDVHRVTSTPDLNYFVIETRDTFILPPMCPRGRHTIIPVGVSIVSH